MLLFVLITKWDDGAHKKLAYELSKRIKIYSYSTQNYEM